MKIVVTGGAGFIGSNFIFHMLEQYPEYRIICLDKLTYAGNMSTFASVMENQNFRFVKADICDREAIDQVFVAEQPDSVVNFAAESHVDRSIESRHFSSNEYYGNGNADGCLPQIRNSALSSGFYR